MIAIVAAAMAGLPVGLPARLREVAFVLLGHLHGLERHAGERGADAGLASEPGPAGDIGSGNSVRRRDLPRAGSRMGPGHRTLCLDAGRPGLGDRAGGHQRADLPRVVLAQSIRIFILVALMPATLTLFGGGSGAHGQAPTTATNTAIEVLATLAASGSWPPC